MAAAGYAGAGKGPGLPFAPLKEFHQGACQDSAPLVAGRQRHRRWAPGFVSTLVATRQRRGLVLVLGDGIEPGGQRGTFMPPWRGTLPALSGRCTLSLPTGRRSGECWVPSWSRSGRMPDWNVQ